MGRAGPASGGKPKLVAAARAAHMSADSGI